MGRGNFKGKREWPVVEYSDSAVSCAKAVELIETLFGIWTWVSPRKYVLDSGEPKEACIRLG